MTRLARFQCLRTAVINAQAWFDSKGFNARDVLIVRLGIYNTFNTADFVDVNETNECTILKFLTRAVGAPIDFIKITEYIDNSHYNMYSYRAPYETTNIEVHDNTGDQWSYYIPPSKQVGYVDDIMTGINNLYTEIQAIPDIVDPNTDIGTLGTKVRTISPLIKAVNTEVKLQYIDTIPKTYAYPKAQGVSPNMATYLDIPEDVVTVIAYLAYKSNFFNYKDEIAHGDVIVFNMKTLYDEDVYNNETSLLKTHDGMLGELLVSIDENITAQGL